MNRRGSIELHHSHFDWHSDDWVPVVCLVVGALIVVGWLV